MIDRFFNHFNCPFIYLTDVTQSLLDTQRVPAPSLAAAFFSGVAPQFAQATVSSQMPAKCITTWNAVPHGGAYVFCLWAADKAEDIETSLGQVLEYVTCDARQVDEIDWAQLAKASS